MSEWEQWVSTAVDYGRVRCLSEWVSEWVERWFSEWMSVPPLKLPTNCIPHLVLSASELFYSHKRQQIHKYSICHCQTHLIHPDHTFFHSPRQYWSALFCCLATGLLASACRQTNSHWKHSALSKQNNKIHLITIWHTVHMIIIKQIVRCPKIMWFNFCTCSYCAISNNSNGCAS